MSQEHRELRCTNPACTYDLQKDRATALAVIDYLVALTADIDDAKVRHVSVSVHRHKWDGIPAHHPGARV